jgi:copper chaperone CopZ
MFRRSFIQRITLASTGAGIASAAAVRAGQNKTVTYRIKGFTCVTCAVGLDTMLRRQTGVIQSKSSYPAAIAVIEFNPHVVTETSLKEFIAELGFTVEQQQTNHE